MKTANKKVIAFVIPLGLVAYFCSICLLCSSIGRIEISFETVLKSFCNYIFNGNFNLNLLEYNTIINIRLPRILMSMLVGISLSLSGCVYQSVFNNELVSPDLLGVTSGSCVGAALAILFGLSGYFIITGAFAFGLLAVVIALLIPILIKSTSNVSLILSGIIVSAIFSSCLGLIKYLVDSLEKLETITFWIMGSFASVSMNDVLLTLPIILISSITLLIMSYRINIVSLGNVECTSLGINFKRNRLVVILCATLLTATSTAICGTVSWIGLIIPHIAKLIVGNDSRKKMPLACILDIVILPLIDTLCRTISIAEIPISIVSAAFGAIVYLILLMLKKRNIYDYT